MQVYLRHDDPGLIRLLCVVGQSKTSCAVACTAGLIEKVGSEDGVSTERISYTKPKRKESLKEKKNKFELPYRAGYLIRGQVSLLYYTFTQSITNVIP